jgi:hypothetical protein
MARRRWLPAHVVLVGILAVLAFPGEGSALIGPDYISLTSTGPAPAALRTYVVHGPVIFSNTDTVAHTVAFADSSCSGDVAPGAELVCGVSAQVGDYGYTVDGTTQASVSVAAEPRAVSLTAKHHAFRLGSRVRLHGTLTAYVIGAPPTLQGPRMPVTVFARTRGQHLWHRIATVHSHPFKKPHYPAHSSWVLWVRPHADTTYKVEANSQPRSGQFWENAQSTIFSAYVRRSRSASASIRSSRT